MLNFQGVNQTTARGVQSPGSFKGRPIIGTKTAAGFRGEFPRSFGVVSTRRFRGDLFGNFGCLDVCFGLSVGFAIFLMQKIIYMV